MNRTVAWIVGMTLLLGGAAARAHEEHEHAADAAGPQAHSEGTTQLQALTGEVVDVFCYLSHGKDGLGKGHAGCAKKCIQGGLPVAIKVGDQLYLATMSSHEAANKTLADLAGEQVTVQGKVMEKDGQHLVSITRVEKTE